MFDFVPAYQPLVHPRPTHNMASAWLNGLYGPTPWTEPRAMLHAAHLPTWVSSKKPPRRPYPAQGAVQARAGQVQMVAWVDSSAVLMQRAANGWDVYPAVLSLGTEVHDTTILTLPYHLRTNAPKLRLRAQEGGMVTWDAQGKELDGFSNADVALALETAIAARAAEITAAPPLLDPRAHTHPEGGRFAPFSPLRPLDAHPTLGTALHAIMHVAGMRSLSFTQPFLPSPWQQRQAAACVLLETDMPMNSCLERAWMEWVRAWCLGKNSLLPLVGQAFWAGGSTQQSMKVHQTGQGASAHQRLAARAELAKLCPPAHMATMPPPFFP